MTRVWQYAVKAGASILFVVLMLFGILHLGDCFGVSASQLKSDIRRGQKIDSSWVTEGEVSGEMAVFISYPLDKSDHTYSIYINRPGFSFGYFFRRGGDVVEMEKYIAEYRLDGYNERAFVSMNQQKAARLMYDDGDSIQVIDIDSKKPFAFVLPVSSGNVMFYDEAGNVVETCQRGM